MKKLVTLKLVSVTYGGTSIGDDIRVLIETTHAVVGFNKRIAFGNTSTFNKEIEQDTVDQPVLEMSVRITMIERDAVFNDEGSIQTKIPIDLGKTLPQKSIHRVAVRESRGYTSSKTAQFDVTLEVRVSDALQYVADVNRGWLTVRREDDYVNISLPAYLKVQLYKTDSKREYCTIMEGLEIGTQVSVKLKEDGTSYLMTGNPYVEAIFATYSIGKKTLTINGRSYITRDYKESPWQRGTYDIEIPDAPHKAGRSYPIKHAMTWFRVGHSGDRYVHMGSASLGCITMIEHEKWEEIYHALIKARKGDSVSIGVLEVVE